MTREHTVRSFDDVLRTVTDDLLRMGRLAHDQLVAATALFGQPAADAAPAILAADQQVDDLDQRIELEVSAIMAMRQPMATDLRALMSCDRIATDLERVADHAKNIAKRASIIAEQGQPIDFTGLRDLADAVRVQLESILKAIEQGDAVAAKAIWGQDEQIDTRYEEVFNAHLRTMCQTPNSATSCTQVLFIAKSLERIGDHVTNIAEDLVYWITGKRLSKRETGDLT